MTFFRFFFKKRKYKDISPDEVIIDARKNAQVTYDSFEDRIETPISSRVIFAVGCVVTLFIGIAASKAFSLQIIQGEDFAQRSENNRLEATPLFGLRGVLYDRNGVALVRNIGTNTEHEVPRRFYAEFDGMAPVIGFVSYPKKDRSGNYWQTEYVGLDGLERTYNDILSGENGQKVIQVNALGEATDTYITQQPRDGMNLTLTLDGELQDATYEILRRAIVEGGFKAGSAVMIDVHSGEVLTLVSAPSFPLYVLNQEDGAQKFTEAQRDPGKPFLNRAISGLYSPGSTIKPFMALAALQEGIISPSKEIESRGLITVRNPYGGPDTIFRDWKVHGYTDMREAIAVSSDVYFYAIGGGYGDQQGLGISKIDAYLKEFGFAEKTGIDLPGETQGVIPTPEWKLRTFNDEWRLGNTYHTSIGQYGFQVTPIQLARSVASIANGGRLVTPHLVQTVRPRTNATERSYRVSPQDMNVIQEGMLQTVTAGTSPVLQQAGFSVAAKSGTAEIGIQKGRVHSWMSGYFPYEKPQYAFVVVLENGPVDTLYGAGKTSRDILRWIAENRPQYAGLPRLSDTLIQQEDIVSGEGLEEVVAPRE